MAVIGIVVLLFLSLKFIAKNKDTTTDEDLDDTNEQSGTIKNPTSLGDLTI